MFFIEFETYLISVLVFSYRCLAHVARMRFIRKDLARKCLHPSEAGSQLAPSEPLDQRMMSIETDNSPQTLLVCHSTCQTVSYIKVDPQGSADTFSFSLFNIYRTTLIVPYTLYHSH